MLDGVGGRFKLGDDFEDISLSVKRFDASRGGRYCRRTIIRGNDAGLRARREG